MRCKEGIYKRNIGKGNTVKVENQKATRPFGLRDKIGYLLGDFGNDFTFILSTIILTKFYTDVMGVPAAAVGTIMMVARFVDAFTDVAMGRICDRSPNTPNGKFKPWIGRMCIPVAAASFLMYLSNLSGLPVGIKIAYLAITYILIQLLTFLTVPWLLPFLPSPVTVSRYPLTEPWEVCLRGLSLELYCR